jgi:hypothetical protein
MHESNGELQALIDERASEQQLQALGEAPSRKHGDTLELEADTLRNIDPPTPYRVVVQIPNGFEYTGAGHSAETALAKRIRTTVDIDLDVTDGHASIARVERGNHVGTGAHPTAVGA